MQLVNIAHIYTDFREKFGLPRQSGLVPSLKGRVVFEKEYRDPNALRELEGYDYIWLIWHFSQVPGSEGFRPMVRPPRLGGNTRVGVFASRSPFRPNPIGLSCVKLDSIEYGSKDGPVLHVSGIDMLSGTPIFDIKPYHPRFEAHPEARGGFSDGYLDYKLVVEFEEGTLENLSPEYLEPLTGFLESDPRPAYQEDESRVYGVSFAGYNVKFKVSGTVLRVTEITS